MRKAFSMLLILGICASFCAHAHAPPDNSKKLVYQEESIMSQTIAFEKYSQVEIVAAETNNQALLPGQHVEIEKIFDDVVRMASGDREIGRPPTADEKWRVDRSRFRWQGSSHV